MKAVGRLSMGRVMPHMMPKALMAALTSAPARTSCWGMSTEVAAPIRLPSRLVSPTGRAMETARRVRARPSGPPGRGAAPARLRRASTSRVRAEKSSQAVIPSTMRPTVRSGFWGRKSRSSPSTAPRPDELLAQLHRRRGADAAGAVKVVLVEVLHPGEQHAGQQQHQPSREHAI